MNVLRLPSLAAMLTCALGCARSTAASFVPSLDLSMRITRTAAQSARAMHEQHLATELVVGLAFRAHSPAAALPAVTDASGLLLAVPCDEGDVTCLDEAAESEPELARVQEDVP